ncbi:non-hydrolyzing UDP-N-acetylglucosamine 2-epimerase [Legionella sp. PC997]|uniref:non-hydrolyzing UDP-N-acetylglucosamine 2-epimerase n=1 Tax=Legionella sp. PC997 TaxID=2755562 RepID=UPI0015FCA283|nr:UDP-N-acetylglucosamine 2-epimerase (non-hydrolyzing) [Legionella sp. PC997]QMT58811.1 UDP-N-acetylglucosamine 2-epimerase (non-hydrolyzing) [Legionella sp. PC997]
MTVNTLCVFGTRPEAIKMAPLVQKLEASKVIQNKICITGQHRQLLDPLLALFRLKPDFDLHVMTANQDLSNLTSRILTGLSDVFKEYQPQLVIVHGDTTSALAASLAAYYQRIPVAHVEAGLRTKNIYSPWPEEANRKLASCLTHLHFAPTKLSRKNLLDEGVPDENIFVTGNTVIDALYQITNQLDAEPVLSLLLKEEYPFLDPTRRIILVTGHRRENFGSGFKRICQALVAIAKRFPDVDIVYPVHLNPHVQTPVNSLLTGIENIYLIPPVDYLPFVYLMRNAYLILTDSGGIQEEAPSLGKPVLVMRKTTERPEALTAGTVKLVGSDVNEIINGVEQLLLDEALYKQMSQAQNPYGDGNASTRIVDIITQIYDNSTNPYLNSKEINYAG